MQPLVLPFYGNSLHHVRLRRPFYVHCHQPCEIFDAGFGTAAVCVRNSVAPSEVHESFRTIATKIRHAPWLLLHMPAFSVACEGGKRAPFLRRRCPGAQSLHIAWHKAIEGKTFRRCHRLFPVLFALCYKSLESASTTSHKI